tara:strand:+ start:62 stop:601 length:540 start_codon:yes stop_codon:yes gene_type:complete
VKVIDNFLPSNDFKIIKGIMMGDYFPWYYTRGITNPLDSGRYQFTHLLFGNREDDGREKVSDNCDRVCSNLIQKLGIYSKSAIIRIKANMNPKTFFHRNGGYHTDYIDQVEKVTTAIFYVNTNNGWTHIKGHGKVKCVENRIALFDSKTQHAGFSCTNEDMKVVININYLTRFGILASV